MSDATKANVNMERVDAFGILANTGWNNVSVTQKVSVLCDKTGGWSAWRNYRLAYGVHSKDGITDRKPTKLKWVGKTIPTEYDPTIEELFKDITLKNGESYYLLFSRLDVKNRFQEAYRILVEAALYRFQDLYMHMPVREDARADDDPMREDARADDDPVREDARVDDDPVREDARVDDDRPTNMRKRGRSDLNLMQVSELLDELSIHCS